MTDLQTREPETQEPPGDRGGHGGHGHWMMIACCIPMLVIAIIGVAAGASVGFLFVALMCTAMMMLMMGAMSGGGEDPPR